MDLQNEKTSKTTVLDGIFSVRSKINLEFGL